MATKAFKCQLRIGDAGTKPTGDGIASVTEVKVNSSREMLDVTTRGNNGSKTYIPGLKDCSMDFSLLKDLSDENFKKVQNAYEAGTAIAAFADDGDGNGVDGDWYVEKMDESQDLDGKISYDTSLKPSPSRPPVQVYAQG
ncbi:hypothetical protein AAEX28_07095 [Lentisphaerota bacterium WC36G]|nr:hypothetical protein LJT99_09960 [Lentisphaerae bacterium WC36]